ncbi:MAG: MCE family protein [Deltaproteobacteria bacterium]|nr:MAG: MCE family protein [Deltaproteobacteria bacterium]
MAKQANRMMIGGFVVLAVIIMAASLVVFGSGKFFKKTNKYVLYFDESIKGLSVGAPVLFQGVPVGSVTSITLQADLTKMKTQIPVFIEIETDRWKVESGERNYRKVAEKLIEMGLRAQLIMQSFITGQLMIELDFYPKTDICYAPAQIDKDYAAYVVIPTCKSTSARLGQALGDLDFKALEKNLNSSLAGIERLVNNPDLAASFQALKDTLQYARKVVARVDRQVDPLANDVKKTVKDIGKLANNVDARVGGVATGLDKTMSAARGVLAQDSPLMVELETMLQEIAAMSRSIRQLANYLDLHPEALIRGKGKPGDKSGGK